MRQLINSQCLECTNELWLASLVTPHLCCSQAQETSLALSCVTCRCLSSVLFSAVLSCWLYGSQTHTVSSLFLVLVLSLGWFMHILEAAHASFPAIPELVSRTVPGHDLLPSFSWVCWQNLPLLPTWVYSGTVRFYGFTLGKLWLSNVFTLCDEIMGCVGEGRAVDAVYLDFDMLNINFTTNLFCNKISASLTFFCGYVQCIQADRNGKWLVNFNSCRYLC